MTPADTALILEAVPVGEAHRAPWRVIWDKLDRFAPVTLRNHLGELATQGLIHRSEARTNSGFVWMYWRDDAVPAEQPRVPSTVLGAG